MSHTTTAPLLCNLKDEQDLRIADDSTDRTPRGIILFLGLHGSLTACVSRAQIFFTSFQVQFFSVHTVTATLHFQDLKLQVSFSELTFRILLLQANLEPNSHTVLSLPFHFLRIPTSFWIHSLCRGWTPGPGSRFPNVISLVWVSPALDFPLTISGCQACPGSYELSWVLIAAENPLCALIRHSPLRLG